MKFKSFLAKPFAVYIQKQIKKGMATAVADQEAMLISLVKSAGKTLFGTDHSFSQIKTHEDFVKLVPIRDYEALKPYIEKIKEGKQNILWKGQPVRAVEKLAHEPLEPPSRIESANNDLKRVSGLGLSNLGYPQITSLIHSHAHIVNQT